MNTDNVLNRQISRGLTVARRSHLLMASGLHLSSPTVCLRPSRPTLLGLKLSLVRWQSSSAAASVPLRISNVKTHELATKQTPNKISCSPMSRLTTWSLVRSIFLSFFLTKPLLLKPGLAMMRKVAESESRLLNPDLNPLMRAVIKPLIYDQFCAGTNKSEIQGKIKEVQDLGFAGVILCYGKEIQLNKNNKILGVQGRRDADIQEWLQGNLKTLDIIESGNWLGIKFTGAGQDVTEALIRGEDPPTNFTLAMREICNKASEKGCRLWVDSEQQAVQASIDRWTISFMREYNHSSGALVYNTVQAYLKESRSKLRHQLSLAQEEGWTLGIKLVRGAYIANDIRHRIHDTKADTDASYNGIVHDLLTGAFEDFSRTNFPRMSLFLAGHNPETVRSTLKLGRELASKGELKVCPEFGQLQGMADEIGCEIVQFGEEAQRSKSSEASNAFIPKAYKCLHWGSVQECMQYLVRRAVENAGAVERMEDAAAGARKEIFRRMTPRVFRNDAL